MNIVCFKWHRNNQGFRLPTIIDYPSEHVNILYRSIKRNYNKPFEFFCVTDDPEGLSPEIKVVKLWDKFKELGGCYRRLWMFSEEARIFGDRFIMMDIDCVIAGDLTPLFEMKEDFVINEYLIERYRYASHQWYNGGLIMMNRGCRKVVWDEFNNNTDKILSEIEKRKKQALSPYKCELVGSDQAVISHILGKGEKVFNEACGVYDYMLLSDRNKLPDNAKIVLFPGNRDPYNRIGLHSWIKDNWR